LREQTEDGIALIRIATVSTTSSKNSLETEADNKREQTVLKMCLCFLSATLFCSGVSVHEV
jgi:hypothetical protein